jgi:hypothetical protein
MLATAVIMHTRLSGNTERPRVISRVTYFVASSSSSELLRSEILLQSTRIDDAINSTSIIVIISTPVFVLTKGTQL